MDVNEIHKIQPASELEFNENSPETNDNLILGQEFQAIFKVLNFAGNSPLGYNEKEGKYEFRWGWKILITLISSVISIFLWTLYFVDVGLNIQIFSFTFRKIFNTIEELLRTDSNFPPSMKIALTYGIRNVLVMFPMAQVSDIFFGYLDHKKLAGFLNNWRNFHEDYVKIFPETVAAISTGKIESDPELQELRKKNKLAFERKRRFRFFLGNFGFDFRMKLANFLSVAFIIQSVLWIVFVASRSVETSLQHRIFFFTLYFRIVTVDTVEDIKILFIFKDLTEAFARIRLGIAQRTKDGEKMTKLTSEEIKNWRKLIDKVRCRVNLTGEIFQLSQLFFFSRSIFIITSYVFLVFNLPTVDPRSSGYVLNWTSAALYQIVRVYFKIYAAEKITTQELLLATELSTMETGQMDKKTLLELKFTHDVISQNPSKITFGNFTTLNKRLLRSIFNQIVTYIVVIMQFVSK